MISVSLLRTVKDAVLDVIQKRKLQKQKLPKVAEANYETDQVAYDQDLRIFPGLTSILETYLAEESAKKPFLIKDGIRIIL